jgi:uncharacterized membrane protein
MSNNKELANSLLTYTFVLFLFIIGFDKIIQTDFISNWQLLVGPIVHFLLPFSVGLIVMIEGVLEIILGILLLTRWKVLSLGLLVITIALIVADLFILHYYNLAIREVILIFMCGAIYLLEETTDWRKW